MTMEEEPRKECLEQLSLTIYTITMILGLPSNVLALIVSIKNTRNQRATPNDVYMINLCLANLVFIAWLPIKILETFKNQWTFPNFVCLLYNFFHFSTIYASILFLTAISAGRFLSIAFPIHYKLYKKARNSWLVCLVLWAIVLSHVALMFITERNGDQYFVSPSDNNTSTCFENFTQEQLDFLVPLRLEMAVVLFFLPLLVTAFCYLSCVVLVLRSSLHPARKSRVVGVAVSTLLIFVACFAPYNISHVVGFIQHQNVWWRREALLTSTCNAFLEPVIFFFLSSSLEHSFRQSWLSVKERWSSVNRKAVLFCTKRSG
ncbi:free fatty acid receptor 2-like [Acipenser ruthenus]|uniref:free fatty acid receptor 2-like n=2 Tax=Acipenser ruthenus TaxID=7906 RepID=UPI002740CC89|nr:free fatty acid receptor 2-like [Acipenser ruthenus]